MGRNKIKIQKIDNDRIRQVTFYKRKRGLIKKSMELSLLCEAKVLLCIIDKNEKLVVYSSDEGTGDIMKAGLCSDKIQKEYLHNNDYKELFSDNLKADDSEKETLGLEEGDIFEKPKEKKFESEIFPIESSNKFEKNNFVQIDEKNNDKKKKSKNESMSTSLFTCFDKINKNRNNSSSSGFHGGYEHLLAEGLKMNPCNEENLNNSEAFKNIYQNMFQQKQNELHCMSMSNNDMFKDLITKNMSTIKSQNNDLLFGSLNNMSLDLAYNQLLYQNMFNQQQQNSMKQNGIFNQFMLGDPSNLLNRFNNTNQMAQNPDILNELLKKRLRNDSPNPFSNFDVNNSYGGAFNNVSSTENLKNLYSMYNLLSTNTKLQSNSSNSLNETNKAPKTE